MTEGSLWSLSDLNESCAPALVRQILKSLVIGSYLKNYQPFQSS
jgi:hypothetical protein